MTVVIIQSGSRTLCICISLSPSLSVLYYAIPQAPWGHPFTAAQVPFLLQLWAKGRRLPTAIVSIIPPLASQFAGGSSTSALLEEICFKKTTWIDLMIDHDWSWLIMIDHVRVSNVSNASNVLPDLPGLLKGFTPPHQPIGPRCSRVAEWTVTSFINWTRSKAWVVPCHGPNPQCMG